MDLNQLYSEHQRALMRLSQAPDRVARSADRAVADAIARRIQRFFLATGADAAASWEPNRLARG